MIHSAFFICADKYNKWLIKNRPAVTQTITLYKLLVSRLDAMSPLTQKSVLSKLYSAVFQTLIFIKLYNRQIGCNVTLLIVVHSEFITFTVDFIGGCNNHKGIAVGIKYIFLKLRKVTLFNSTHQGLPFFT